jgi:hypothetical protein
MISAPAIRLGLLATLALLGAAEPRAPGARGYVSSGVLTPYQTLSAPNLINLRRLNTANGAPAVPTPNPWFVLEPYQGTITRADFEKKLHDLYDPFSAFQPFLDINDQRVVIYPSATDRRVPQFTRAGFARRPSFAPSRTRSTVRWKACGSRSIPATSAANGRNSRSAARATTAARRCGRAT